MYRYFFRISILVFIPLFLSIAGFVNAATSIPHSEADAYEAGRALIAEGNVNDAINLWIEEKARLQQLGEADFRIGIAAIEAITEHQLSRLYPLASNFYFWGLESRDIQRFKPYIAEELDRLSPLMPESLHAELVNRLKEGSPDVLAGIRGFFVQLNPVLTSNLNERLIEHWERIAYARKHFTRSRSSVYGTDDRGLIYVRYGPADRIETGSFTMNVNDILGFAGEIINQQEREQAQNPSRGFDNEPGGLMGFILDEMFKDNLAKLIADNVLTTRISDRYEIWIYENRAWPGRRNVTFMFGVNAQTGTYGLQTSPESFIPQSAFRERRMRMGDFNFNAGPLIQLSMYKDLRFVDDTYMDIYYDYFDRLLSDESIIQESGYSYLLYRYADELEAIRNLAPQISSVYDELSDIPLEIRQYRFLDEVGAPIELVYLYSMPHTRIVQDYNRFQQTEEAGAQPEYHLRHSVSTYTGSWQLLDRTHDFPPVFFDRFGPDGRMLPGSSAFLIRANEEAGAEDNGFRISATLFNEAYSGQQFIAGTDALAPAVPRSLLAETNIDLKLESLDNPLPVNQPAFSDIVLGYVHDELSDDEQLTPFRDDVIPFFVPSRRAVPQGALVELFFDVYGLHYLAEHSENPNDTIIYRLQYQVDAKEQRNALQRLFSRGQSRTQATVLELETRENSGNHLISIDTSDYVSGSYELTISLLNENDEVMVSRTLPFEVFEN
ncbi:GWxTD domain-containing protein [Cyclonatronum proteinivorum]|uniref:GWxTD domain-containing protein n=1 Tax=Cyclonatronum proteinivorum TaxID=1457365 RepID=A0A345UID8_9BACT|nr:GWxTD domain-containing protein [Cyclonatronum proteinivorum]AXJ00240.1 GWxTD domain-containing protein [Cyclonatronum proteinivorum]